MTVERDDEGLDPNLTGDFFEWPTWPHHDRQAGAIPEGEVIFTATQRRRPGHAAQYEDAAQYEELQRSLAAQARFEEDRRILEELGRISAEHLQQRARNYIGYPPPQRTRRPSRVVNAEGYWVAVDWADISLGSEHNIVYNYTPQQPANVINCTFSMSCDDSEKPRHPEITNVRKTLEKSRELLKAHNIEV